MFHFEGAAVTRIKASALQLLLFLRLFKPSLNAVNKGVCKDITLYGLFNYS